MTGERVEFRRCDAAPLEIGGRRLRGSEVAVWDVMSVLPKDVPPLDGVLALDRLAGQPFTLDLSGRTLTLESAASLDGRVAGMKRLEARVATGMLASTGSTPPSSGLLTLDGLPSAEVPTRVREIIHDGVLAESFLSRWVWTFRLATGELWAAPVR